MAQQENGSALVVADNDNTSNSDNSNAAQTDREDEKKRLDYESSFIGPRRLIHGSKRCPACGAYFAKRHLRQTAWPPGSAWYFPSRIKMPCPHCQTPLTSRYRRRWLIPAIFLMQLVYLCSGDLPDSMKTGPLVFLWLLIVAVLISLAVIMAYRGYRDENAYLIDRQ